MCCRYCEYDHARYGYIVQQFGDVLRFRTQIELKLMKLELKRCKLLITVQRRDVETLSTIDLIVQIQSIDGET